MKILRFNSEEEWLDGRLGKITGTKADGLVSKVNGKPLKGFYELIAERVAIPASGENVMDRGHRLEGEAIDRFEKETGKKVNKDLVMFTRDDYDAIAYSPDGYIGKTEDVEVKCLNSARHIEAILTKAIPKEYMAQILQGFVVNDSLKKRYMVFYDPRMPIDYFCIEVDRKDYADDIKFALDTQIDILKQVEIIESTLTFND